jgi:hypothetical protein
MNATRYVSFTFLGKQGAFSRKPCQRIFLPADNPAVQRIREIGYFYFALIGRAGCSPFFRIDFSHRPEALNAYRALFTLPDEDPFLRTNPDFRDEELDFWDLMGWEKAHWHNELSMEDKAQAKWAEVCVLVRRKLAQLLANEVSAEPARSGFYESPESEAEVRERFPSLFATVASLQAQPLSLFRAYHAMHGTLNDSRALLALLLNGTPTTRCFFSDDGCFLLRQVLQLCLLSPQTTRSGTRRPWLDGRSNSESMAVRYWENDLSAGPERADLVWMAMLDEREWIDAGYILDGGDCPMGTRRLGEACKMLKLHGSIEDGQAILHETIAEANEARQWSVPWGARVEVGLGELRYVDIYELEGEFMCYFRDQADRYAMVAVGLGASPACAPPRILSKDKETGEFTECPESALALALIAAAIVRDFVVVENRESQFLARVGTRRVRGTSEKIVVYLPRTRYQRAEVGSRDTAEHDYSTRAPHAVHALSAGTQ